MPDTATPQATDWSAAVTAALDWWRDAGIDHAFVDEPVDWLAAHSASAPDTGPSAAMPPRREPARAASESPAAPPQLDRTAWPQTLEAFAPWWLAQASLAPAGLRRFAPQGPASAALMVLVPMPSVDDKENILDGRAGRLLDALLAAVGQSRAQTYIASALPAHVPMPDWAQFHQAGLGEVLMHHITLAAPRRLLILGNSGISALLGHDPTNKAQSLRAINQDGSPLAALPSWDLEAMLARPALKERLWSRWLEWTGTETF
ncbi:MULTISPECIES: hypothetical protein [unclassified Novosphingobium]|uniref:hypothetical protein n=1 Tax=unclassified Novosphingobium TaxID=2644732 RepID=UPI0025CEF03E|nr:MULTISPECIES: hypothetical protein [unclassified Novosphingobium]HQS70758.1 hypothetical protein [Novosphingobium sp.]